MNDKIKAVKFEILGGEGRVVSGTFETWGEIGQYVREEIAVYESRTGGYSKTDFQITFSDGETYNGRLDVMHPTYKPHNDNDVAQHVHGFQSFYAGTSKPDHMSQARYEEFINRDLELKQQAIDFLATYDIPENDGQGHDTKTVTCLQCWQEFAVLSDESGAVCGSCVKKNATKADQEKKRAEREADPLWAVKQEGRTAVTKKVRQLLKERSGKTWSVTGDRGTAWAWINVTSPKSRRVSSQKRAYMGLTPMILIH